MAQSARFRGDGRLEAIIAGDEAQFLRFGDEGAAVRAVQGALIDHGFGIADGATGFFGQQTADAVVLFKRANGLAPDDPVAGVRTVSTLDVIFALPLADRREWTESFGRGPETGRPAIDPRPLQAINFSRFKEQGRRLNAVPFTFDVAGVQLPPAYVAPFLAGMQGLLEPSGSPIGAQSEPATWGVSPFDLYHAHLAVRREDADAPGSDWLGRQRDYATRIHGAKATLNHIADASGLPRFSPGWTEVYRTALLAPVPDMGATLAALTETWLGDCLAESLATGHQLHFLWHSFESVSPHRWRPHGLASADRRRSWWNVVAPLPGPVAQTPFDAGHGLPSPWTDLGQIAFLIDDGALVTIMAPDREEVAALLGFAMDAINPFDAAPALPPDVA